MQGRNPVPASIKKYAVLYTGRIGTRHPARVAAKLLKVTGAGTIRKQAAKRKNL
jgi:hypothetical protein